MNLNIKKKNLFLSQCSQMQALCVCYPGNEGCFSKFNPIETAFAVAQLLVGLPWEIDIFNIVIFQHFDAKNLPGIGFVGIFFWGTRGWEGHVYLWNNQILKPEPFITITVKNKLFLFPHCYSNSILEADCLPLHLSVRAASKALVDSNLVA